jgi:hypothetical protein
MTDKERLEEMEEVALHALQALSIARQFILKKHGAKNPFRDRTIARLERLAGKRCVVTTNEPD